MPGLTLALRAMSERAAALPPISIESPVQVDLLGRTTEEAMRSGVLYGHASMVDGMVDRIEARIGQPVTVVATGGNAPRILCYCRHEIQYDARFGYEGALSALSEEYPKSQEGLKWYLTATAVGK